MDKKKSIMVSINGKKEKVHKKYNRLNRSHYTEPMPMDHYEFTQYDMDKSSPTKHQPKGSTRSSGFHLKPLFIAILSAIVIGSILGLLMLIIFKGVGGNETPAHLPVNTNNEEEQQGKEEIDEEKQLSETTGFSAYVLQSGVFSQLENAEQWKETYEDLELPTIIWERDGQYYLFAGIAEKKAEVKAFADQLKQDDVDIFIKEWRTNATEIRLTEEEHEWIESFQTLWKDSLQSVGNENGFPLEQWDRLMNESSIQTEAGIAFHKQLIELLKDEKIADDPFYQQHFLLVAWYQFEEDIRDK